MENHDRQCLELCHALHSQWDSAGQQLLKSFQFWQGLAG